MGLAFGKDTFSEIQHKSQSDVHLEPVFDFFFFFEKPPVTPHKLYYIIYTGGVREG